MMILVAITEHFDKSLELARFILTGVWRFRSGCLFLFFGERLVVRLVEVGLIGVACVKL